MHNDQQRAQQYRYRAEELRAVSASWLEENARNMLERVACDYERMAALLERRIEAGAEHAAVFGSGDTRQ